MATKAVLTAVALCLCVQFIFAAKFVWLSDEQGLVYSVMCTNKTGYKATPMPPDNCEMEKYIECLNGKAKTITECPEGKFFNRTTLWCEPDVNVTRPPGCPATPQVKRYPLNCQEVRQLPEKVPVAETCKKYIECDQTGNHQMNCPGLSFYVPEKKECISLMQPYVNAMSQSFIQKCNELDRWENSP